MNPLGSSLGWMQRELELTYELRVPQEVDDYLFTDRAVAARLGPAHPVRIPETLYIIEADQNIDVGLFIDENVVAALSADHPVSRLHAGNLADFCIALEGVSHFMYLVWNAGHERAVSQLELEIQAEVDKFVMASLLFARQQGGIPAGLGRWLFDDPSYHQGMSVESVNRYAAANHYAGKYCRRLERRYLRVNQEAALMNELRRFYRLPRQEKLRHIDRHHHH